MFGTTLLTRIVRVLQQLVDDVDLFEEMESSSQVKVAGVDITRIDAGTLDDPNWVLHDFQRHYYFYGTVNVGFDDTDDLNAARRQSVPTNHVNISLTPPTSDPARPRDMGASPELASIRRCGESTGYPAWPPVTRLKEDADRPSRDGPQ